MTNTHSISIRSLSPQKQAQPPVPTAYGLEINTNGFKAKVFELSDSENKQKSN